MQILNKDDLEGVLKSNKKVYVQFSAGWCGPCKALSKYIDDNKSQLEDVVFCKVDVEKCDQSLLSEHKVSSLPKSVLFLDQQKIGEYLGFNPTKFADMVSLYTAGGL